MKITKIKLIIAAIASVLVVGGGIVTFNVINSDKNEKKNEADDKQQTQITSETDISGDEATVTEDEKGTGEVATAADATEEEEDTEAEAVEEIVATNPVTRPSAGNRPSSNNNSSNRPVIEGNKPTPIVPEDKPTTGATTEATTDESTTEDKPSTDAPVAPVEPSEDEDFTLIWEENFDGTSLNGSKWNMETHEPGWVNNELQEYTASTDNIYVEDGKLVLRAIKTTKDGKDYYTSGKVTTQNKFSFKYGKVEVRAKSVEGQGLWPAIWMMPEDESFYGQWPKCGEIDIMEVLGHEPNTTYGTIHYGDPHKEDQGKYVASTSLAEAYHTYSVEWEPSFIRFYIDGILVNEATDWFTAVDGGDEVTFPAPFDQNFYIQLNLAVGGNWPGNPDATTDFDKAAFMVDYVKVYQKESYDENVSRPTKEVVLRDPDATGNYIINGDFAVNEDLSDDVAWGEKYALGGVGKVTLANNTMTIKTENAGTADYSIQVVQPNLPMKKGGKYKLTFDAWADADRTMKIGVTGPDNSFIRYFGDKEVALGTAKQSYTYEFTMEKADDANGRLEFNLGNQNSTATVYIQNVRLEKTGEEAIEAPAKTVTADGNFVYNGTFDKGTDRLAYWTVSAPAKVETYVSNDNGRREFTACVPSGILTEAVVLSQDIAISANKDYKVSFDAYSTKAKSIKVAVGDDTRAFDIGTDKATYSYVISTGDAVENKNIFFLLGGEGDICIDNVSVREDGLLVNGDFSNNKAGWTVFTDSSVSSKVASVVDSMNGNTNAMAIEMQDTGAADWHVQLMQEPIALENGKSYKLTFKAKTNLAGGRDITYAIQRNGSADNDWTPYSGTKTATLTAEYQTFDVIFTMDYESDPAARLSFTMGAVGGRQITTKHSVYIDDVTLEEVEAPVIEVPVIEGNMIKNPEFADGEDGLDNWEKVVVDGGVATFSKVSNGGMYINITDVGTQDHSVQLKQKTPGLNNGHTYKIKMVIDSEKARTVKAGLMTSAYDWYGGADIALTAGTKEYITTFTVDKATSNDITFFLSMGKIADVDTPAGAITIKSVWFGDITDEAVEPEEPSEDVSLVEGNMLKNGNFKTGLNGWSPYTDTASGAVATIAALEDGGVKVDISNLGTADWNVQIKQQIETAVIAGHNYRVEMIVDSEVARTIKTCLMTDGNGWCGGAEKAMVEGEQKLSITFVADAATRENTWFQISMGKVAATDSAGTFTIKSISLVDLDAVVDEPSEDVSLVEGNMLKNGNFKTGFEPWTQYVHTSDGAAATIAALENGGVKVDISNVGTADWNVQIKQQIETAVIAGHNYKVEMIVDSEVARTIKTCLMTDGDGWCGGAEKAMVEGEQKLSITFVADAATRENTWFQISMGKVAATDAAGTFTIKSIALVDLGAAIPETTVPQTLAVLEPVAEDIVVIDEQENGSIVIAEDASTEETASDEDTTDGAQDTEEASDDIISDEDIIMPDEDELQAVADENSTDDASEDTSEDTKTDVEIVKEDAALVDVDEATEVIE